MILKKRLLLVLLCITSHTVFTQNTALSKKDSTVVSSWIAGIGFHAIDDSEDAFRKLFDIKDAWNAVPYPSRLSIGRYFKNGIGLEAILAYNKYKKGKEVGITILEENKNYFSIDSRLSYDLNKIIGETGWFDPYVGVGLGYTHANDGSRGTYNGVIGFRTWFSDRVGLDFNSSGKWRMNNNTTNHLQHAIGVVYRFKAEKDLTKKGKKKLDLINELEKENTRIKDSLAFVAEVEQKNKELEEKFAQVKEKERLAQLEKEKQEALIKKENTIKKAIDALDKINFNFDSSNLNTLSKNTLSELITILNDYPELIIEISSHTDSRGSAVYNQKLSEQRLKSTIKYLLEKQVSEDKIIGKAHGEEKLLNECDDNTKCSEAKHKENRRSEIKIVKF
ncbi:OmpA family protein [Flaviramulus sp. BrNp1-15]|uniref:OmpA family protein n=1 Tax=Flaviramulus sp. BrNp1-15 TaxID=2916754 RepID=UPI001EE936D9|nr:OmpA family protein [Flaviramulus sp. BrNp1-15]ULC58348.1 OmpA family protein [Flaviramulus sp. BrNp1-15]